MNFLIHRKKQTMEQSMHSSSDSIPYFLNIYQVLLKFPKFTLQTGTNTDNVQLYDGQNETSPSLGVYAGGKVPPASGIQSSSNELFIIFKTDSKANFAGFQASYSAQRPTREYNNTFCCCDLIFPIFTESVLS